MARKSRSYGEKQEISMTSLMDVMTIILVFLLKQIDAEGQLVTAAENLVLPASTSKKVPTEVSMGVVVDQSWVLVDGQQITETKKVADQDSLLVEALDIVLQEKRAVEKEAMLQRGEADEGGGKVIIQLDKNTHFGIMYKVMATCGLSGFSNISFAVNMKNQEE
jgi:biopolymer transport protein ExbD